MIPFKALLISCLIQISTAQDQTGTVSQHVISDSKFAKPLNNKSHAGALSESEIAVTSTHPSGARLRADENYKTPSRKSDDIDIMNDSSEDLSDANQKLGLGFDDFVLPKAVEKEFSPLSYLDQLKSMENVFKVPKSRNKKTLPQPLRSSQVDPSMTEPFSFGGNLTQYQNDFHAFTSLYDHFLWNSSSFTAVNNLCLEDIKKYLNALKSHASWAIKVSDASGKYRGLFFFDNDYWLGKSMIYLLFAIKVELKSLLTPKKDQSSFAMKSIESIKT